MSCGSSATSWKIIRASELAAPVSARPPHPLAILVAQHPARVAAFGAVVPPVVEAIRPPDAVALIIAVDIEQAIDAAMPAMIAAAGPEAVAAVDRHAK